MSRPAEHGKHHCTTIEDRGAGHTHRWQPRCSCGWRGVPGKTKWARQQVRDHKRAIDRHTRVVQKGRVPNRRPLTPTEDLPEALR